MSVALLNAAYEAMCALDLAPLARLALTALAWRADRDGLVSLSKRELGRQMGTTKPNAIRCVNELKVAGLLRQDEALALDVPALLEAAKRGAWSYGKTPRSQGETSGGLTVRPEGSYGETSGGLTVRPEGSYGETSGGLTVRPKRSYDETPYKTIKTIKTKHTPNACACVREETPPSLPSGLPEAATPRDVGSFQLFHRSYPKHRASADVRALMALWRQAEDAIGGADAGKRLLACLSLAKRSKRWGDEGGSYVSKEENFLSGHYSQFVDESAQELKSQTVATRQRSQDESDIAFFRQINPMVDIEEARARRQAQVDDICDQLFGGSPKTWEEKVRWDALRPRAEALYEQGKRDGTLKPLVLNCDKARLKEVCNV